MLQQIENEILEQIQIIASNIDIRDLLAADAANKPFPYMVRLFEYIKENGKFIKSLLGSKGDPLFPIKLKKLIENNMFEKKLMKSLKREKILIPKEYFFSYVLSAHIGVIQQWLESGMQKTPEEIALILSKMFFLGLFKVTGLDGN